MADKKTIDGVEISRALLAESTLPRFALAFLTPLLLAEGEDLVPNEARWHFHNAIAEWETTIHGPTYLQAIYNAAEKLSPGIDRATVESYVALLALPPRADLPAPAIRAIAQAAVLFASYGPRPANASGRMQPATRLGRLVSKAAPPEKRDGLDALVRGVAGLLLDEEEEGSDE